MLQLAEIGPKDTLLDLGCGDGRILIAAVKYFRAKRAVGVEAWGPRVTLARKNAREAGVKARVTVRRAHVEDLTDLSQFTVITSYLFEEQNHHVCRTLRHTIRPGTRMVFHDYTLGGGPTNGICTATIDRWEKTLKCKKFGISWLYLWRVGVDEDPPGPFEGVLQKLGVTKPNGSEA